MIGRGLAQDPRFTNTLLAPAFIGTEPDEPNVCTTLYDLPGENPVQVIGNTAVGPRKDAIQVRVRDMSYTAAQQRLEAIWEACAGLRAQSIPEGRVRIDAAFYRVPPQWLLRDQKVRFIWVATVMIVRSYS